MTDLFVTHLNNNTKIIYWVFRRVFLISFFLLWTAKLIQIFPKYSLGAIDAISQDNLYQYNQELLLIIFDTDAAIITIK
jgi:hypothetical protein